MSGYGALTPEEDAELDGLEKRERLTALRKRQEHEKASAELRRAMAVSLGRDPMTGGPPKLVDQRSRLIQAVVSAWAGPDADPPTQEAVASLLGISDRRIRQMQGKAGWSGLIDAARKELTPG